jgi:hypothetical protein
VGVKKGKMLMRSTKLVACGVLTALAIVVPLSSASAHCCWHHHRYGPVVGVVGAAGAVVEGALTIATLPVVLAADIVSAPFEAAAGPGYYSQPYYGGPAYGNAAYGGPAYAYYGPRPYYGPRYRHRRYYRRAYCCSYGY